MVSGEVSLGEMEIDIVRAVNPTFRRPTRETPSGRNSSVTVPVDVVSALRPDRASRTSTPSIGSPVCSLKTPNSRPRYDGAVARAVSVDCAPAVVVHTKTTATSQLYFKRDFVSKGPSTNQTVSLPALRLKAPPLAARSLWLGLTVSNALPVGRHVSLNVVAIRPYVRIVFAVTGADT